MSESIIGILFALILLLFLVGGVLILIFKGLGKLLSHNPPSTPVAKLDDATQAMLREIRASQREMQHTLETIQAQIQAPPAPAPQPATESSSAPEPVAETVVAEIEPEAEAAPVSPEVICESASSPVASSIFEPVPTPEIPLASSRSVTPTDDNTAKQAPVAAMRSPLEAEAVLERRFPKSPAQGVQPSEWEQKVSDFELRSSQLFSKLWNWLCVGEEFRNPNLSAEFAIATTWLVRGAVLILLCGVAFFLKYSYDNNLVSPVMRVIFTLLFGGVLAAIGFKLEKGQYRLVALGLFGCGIVCFYLGIFAAYRMYELLGQLTAFGLMVLITAGSMVIALRVKNAFPAIIGTIGGYLTPIALSSGSNNILALFSYMAILSAGLLLTARYRNWKSLTILAFLFNWGIYIGALVNSYHLPGESSATLGRFLTALGAGIVFFLIFSFQSILFNLWNKVKITLVELLLLLATYACALGSLLYVIYDYTEKRQNLAYLALGMCLFYTLFVSFFLRLKLKDRNLALSLLTLAALNLMLIFPLYLSGSWITAAWSMAALALLFLGIKTHSNALKSLAFLSYGASAIRIFAFDGTILMHNSDHYLRGFVDRGLSLGIFALALFGGAALMRKESLLQAKKFAFATDSDLEQLRPISQSGKIFQGFGILFGAFFLALEAHYFGLHTFVPLTWLFHGYLLVALMLLTLYLGKRSDKQQFYNWVGGVIVLLFVLLILKFMVQEPRWSDSHIIPWSAAGTIGFRLLEFLPLALLLYFAGSIAGKMVACNPEKNLLSHQLQIIFATSATLLLFLYTTLEWNFAGKHFFPYFRLGAISIWWGLFALGLLGWGLKKNSKAARFAGLLLFLATGIKIFFFDLADLGPLAKVGAFIALGGVMLAAAIVYIRCKDHFSTAAATTKTENE